MQELLDSIETIPLEDGCVRIRAPWGISCVVSSWHLVEEKKVYMAKTRFGSESF